jgi:thiosulfate/3-mercaptopyruvate sulfurtransferase
MNYPNILFVSPAWVNERVSDDALVLLDVRAGQSYNAYTNAHLPNARPFSLPHCKSAALGIPDGVDEEALATQLGELGVQPRHTVVLYDDELTHNATLGFWALEYIGQEQVYLLEGGLSAWQASGLPVTQGTATWQSTPYHRHLRHTRTYATDLPPAASHHLLDVRGVQEYHAAHIEGATHCCWTELVQDLHTLTLLPPEAISAKLTALNLYPDHEITTYCRSGARGSFVYFVLRLMGWERVRLYDGSMNDWLLREQPVVVG